MPLRPETSSPTLSSSRLPVHELCGLLGLAQACRRCDLRAAPQAEGRGRRLRDGSTARAQRLGRRRLRRDPPRLTRDLRHARCRLWCRLCPCRRRCRYSSSSKRARRLGRRRCRSWRCGWRLLTRPRRLRANVLSRLVGWRRRRCNNSSASARRLGRRRRRSWRRGWRLLTLPRRLRANALS